MSGESAYPIAVIEDRYGGAYSGGDWIAIAKANIFVEERNTRAQYVLDSGDGPFSGDVPAAEFWANPPDWIAVGSRPEDAIENLHKRMGIHSEPDAEVLRDIEDFLRAQQE